MEKYMKTFGIKISIIIGILFSNLCSAQECGCVEFCDNNSTSLIAEWSFQSNQTVGCDGLEIILNNDTDPNQGIDEYIWDFGDGTILSFPTNQNVTHTYNIPDSLVCLDDKTTFGICLIVVKNCDNGVDFSCHHKSSGISIIHRPQAEFITPTEACVNTPIDITNLSCNAESYLWNINGTTYTDEVPNHIFSSPGTYNISLEVTGQIVEGQPCGSDTYTQTINVVDEPVSNFDISPLPVNGKICNGQVLTLTDQSNQWSNTQWEILPGGDTNWCFTDTLMNLNSNVIEVEFKQTTTYTIRLIAENACGQDIEEILIESLDGPTIDLEEGPRFCESGSYTPDVSYMGDIDSYKWTFEGGLPNMSTDPFPGNIQYNSIGTFLVTLEVVSACGTFTATTNITVDANIPVNITPMNQICATSSPDTLMVDVPGGTWSGDGIDPVTGVFDPGAVGVGTYNISYQIMAGACSNQDTIQITVIPSEIVTVNSEGVCETLNEIQLNANPQGGTWSGLYVDQNGVFNVDSSGVGSFSVDYFYTDTNNCDILSNGTVNVEPLPSISISDTTFLCTNGGTVDLETVTNFTTDISGGSTIFFIDTIQAPNPYTIGGNLSNTTLIVEYTLNNCITSDTAMISIIDPPMLTISPDTMVCINDSTLQLIASLNSGEWIGDHITSTGEINLTALGDGIFNFEYVAFSGTSCEVSDNVIVQIVDPGINLSVGPNIIELCEGEMDNYTFTGFSPIGGTFSGQGIIDSNGIVDINLLQTDTTYEYQYCISNSDFMDCEACATTSIIIHSSPTVAFEIEGGTCIGDTLIITNTSTGSAIYNWDFGDGIISNEFEPSHIYTSSQNYTVSLVATSSQGCTLQRDTTIYVSQPPVVGFSISPLGGCAPLDIDFTNSSTGDNITYEWLIANDTLTNQIPSNIVLDSVYTDSIFDITLNVINSCGIVSQTEQVLVNPYPIIDLGINPDEGCTPLEIEITANLLGNPDSFTLDLGNGSMTVDSIPNFQTYFTTDSTVTEYTLSLSAINQCGEGHDEETVTVYPPDVMAFIQLDTLSICQSEPIPISSVSTQGSILTWSVFDNLGNLVNGYISDNPSITINQAGVFDIVLYASRCGTDTDTVSINVLPAPEIDFTIPDFICLGDSIAIENNSIDISESEWDLGNGNISNLTSPIISFDSIGTYTITLTAYSEFYECPNTISKTIEVIGLPLASFQPSQFSGCQPLTVNFENESLGATSYFWDWGDGTSGSNAVDTSHTFLQDGSYKVTLRAFDDFGCFNDTSVINIIVNPKPESLFDVDKSFYCQFHDSIKVISLSEDITGFEWIFNNEYYADAMPTFFNDTQGNQSIEYIVENQFGCLDTSLQIVQILPSPIARSETIDTIGCQPLKVNVANFSEQADSYQWQINNQEVSSDSTLTFLFSDFGTQNISLIALNENGCPGDTSHIAINVLEKPEVDFQFFKDNICGVPMNVDFVSNVSGNIIDYDWNFGDGSNSQLTNPSNTYNIDQDFEVSLIVENEFSCFDTIRKTIPIWHQPIADFSIDETIYCEDELIFINNNSLHGNQIAWKIDGLDVLNEFNPIIDFDEAGSYGITLCVEYNEFCKDSLPLELDILIVDTPIAEFSFTEDVNVNIIGDVVFQNESLDYDEILWDLGDGSSSNLESFLHEYDINRNIIVSLIAFNFNNGIRTCTDTIQKTIVPEWSRKFYAPNAFAPNYGNGEHTLFVPKGVGIESYELKVYSKFGDLVWVGKETSNGSPTDSWNGQIFNNGEEVPKGTYIWQAEVNFDGNLTKVFHGNVTVLR